MKYRSVVIFSVIVLALAVMPEATQQVFDLAGATQNRVKTEILNAFLGLHAQKHEAPAARPAAHRSISEDSDVAVKSVRASDATTQRDKIASAQPRRSDGRLDAQTPSALENGFTDSDARRTEVFEMASLHEALPDFERLSKEFEREVRARAKKHAFEQDILVDPDPDIPSPHSQPAPKTKDVSRVALRFAVQNARHSGAQRDALMIKIRRKVATELKSISLSANNLPAPPKPTAPGRQVCPTTLASPAPQSRVERTFETHSSFATRL